MDSRDNEDYSESYGNDTNYSDLLFYTPKIIQHIDDADIVQEIFFRYPPLKEASNEKQEKEERKAFAALLQQKHLINEILEKYNLTIIDIVKIFYRRSPHIFNTVTYSNKLKRIIETNGYRTELQQ